MKATDDTTSWEALKNAIFTICGSRDPKRKCLDQIGREASRIARKSRPWSGAWLYMLIHLDRYAERHNNGHIKYGINPDLLRAVLELAKHEAAIGKQSVSVYAIDKVREGSIVFGRSKKCKRRRCGVYFVTDGKRLYCSDECERLIRNFRRKDAIRKHQIELARKRAARARARAKAKRDRVSRK